MHKLGISHLLSLISFDNMSKYQGRIDALDLLRSTYSQGKRAKLRDNALSFEKDVRLPLLHPTAWVSPLSKKRYNLGSLWLFLESHLGHITDYMLKVSEHGLDNVTVSDRQAIADYFLGKVSESECINQEIKLELATKSAKRDQPSSGFDEGGEGGKKVKA